MMEARLQVRVQRYGWDAAASWYQEGWQAQLRPAHDTLIEMASLSPGMKIIETACGTGLVTPRIADLASPDGKVLATDLSQSMIDTLDRSLSTALHQHIQTERMEADRIARQLSGRFRSRRTTTN
jgi:cyclopropane fatty-acyl-phospholipid synthase-like methyltransferase